MYPVFYTQQFRQKRIRAAVALIHIPASFLKPVAPAVWLVRRNLCFDFPGRIHGQDAFYGEPGKQHPDGGMCY
jgi:hypothetical protein